MFFVKHSFHTETTGVGEVHPELGEKAENVLLESTAAVLWNKTVLPKKRQISYLRAAAEINEGPRRCTIMADKPFHASVLRRIC